MFPTHTTKYSTKTLQDLFDGQIISVGQILCSLYIKLQIWSLWIKTQ